MTLLMILRRGRKEGGGLGTRGKGVGLCMTAGTQTDKAGSPGPTSGAQEGVEGRGGGVSLGGPGAKNGAEGGKEGRGGGCGYVR